MIQSNESPIGNDSSDTMFTLKVFANDQVLNCSRIEKRHIRQTQNLRKKRRGKEGCMLDNDEIPFIFIWHIQLIEEDMSRFPDNHRSHQLTTEPGSSARRDISLENGDFDCRCRGRQMICAGQPSGTSAYDHDITHCALVHVGEVPRITRMLRGRRTS